MSETKTYTGSCHCGKVSFEVTSDLKQVLSCNCSMCSRTGALLTFVPESQFKPINDGPQTTYLFNRHVIQHLFCNSCGIRSFARGSLPNGDKMVAINVRCLDGVDPKALTITEVDGRSR